MKKIILSSAIFIFSVLGVQAQRTNAQPELSANQIVEKAMNALTSACTLTPEQVSKIQPIVTKAVNENRANKQKYAADKNKLKAVNDALLKRTETQISALLNPDQQSEFVSFEQHRKAAMQGNTTAAYESQ